jgi:hypothetical protein
MIGDNEGNRAALDKFKHQHPQATVKLKFAADTYEPFD